MLFNSYIFIFLFLPISLLGWYGLNRIKKYQTAQIFLIAMSLWFYAYFNSYYLAVILGSCAINYFFSFILAKKPALHRVVLLAGCIVNLGILGVFKYYDFCVENLNAVFHAGFTGKNILLPLGISFFTFQQLSFVIDRCKEKAPHYGLTDYLSFVTFFPQLIAGPIVLHTEIIPQFQNVDRRKFEVNDFAYGICYFVFGLSKKVLLADTLAGVVNYGFSEIAKLDTPAAAMVAVSFALDLYFDFSGYCDMAIGIGRMFGIRIPDNFNAPYRSASVKEFWKRWHITLGRFFTQYVYIPLGGSRKGTFRTVFNTMIVFLLSGLWHGADWSFVLWGFLHGLGVSANVIWRRFVPAQKKETEQEKSGFLKRLRRFVCQAVTFGFVCLAFVFFRSDSVADGFLFMKRLFSGDSYHFVKYIADELSYAELYVPTKIITMMFPAFLRDYRMYVCLAILFVSMLLAFGKTTKERLENRKLTAALSWKMTILFVWSVISLTGVSTFLYFNF